MKRGSPRTLFKLCKELLNDLAGIALTQFPWFAQFGGIAELEERNRNRTVLAIPLSFLIRAEALAQNGECLPDDIPVLALERLTKRVCNLIKASRCMLKAINQVVGILSLIAIVEGKSLQASETHHVRMLDLLSGYAISAKKFGMKSRWFDAGRIQWRNGGC